ncbi:unnamed protein product, partial [Laminaria digitata]
MAFTQATRSPAASSEDAADGGGDGEGGLSARDKLIDHSVRLEVDAFRASPKIKMYEMMEGGNKKVFCDPLAWWRSQAARLPHLSRLARRVLAVPGMKPRHSYWPVSEWSFSDEWSLSDAWSLSDEWSLSDGWSLSDRPLFDRSFSERGPFSARGGSFSNGAGLSGGKNVAEEEEELNSS